MEAYKVFTLPTNKRGKIMKIKDFLEENKGKNFIIEVENGIIKKITIEEMKYEIKNDELYLINGSNLDFAVINLNIIRNFNVNNGKVVIFLEDKKETKIKISVI